MSDTRDDLRGSPRSLLRTCLPNVCVLLLASCTPADRREPPSATASAGGKASAAPAPNASRKGRRADAPAAASRAAPTTVNPGRAVSAGRRIPARGTDSTLDVASWNVEWFGDPTHEPANDRQQGELVREVIQGTDADIWGMAEIVDMQAWSRLKASLPDYDGFLANEGPVTSRARHYGETEQKVGVLYKRSVARLLGARVILPQHNHDFAGRPPLQVRLRVTVRGRSDELVLIVVHMKASADDASWQRRARAAAALKAYVDGAWPSSHVLVVGDWNDDVDRSVSLGKPSPFAAFTDDAPRYRFLTAPLSRRGVSSTASHRELIDHQLASRPLADTELPNSVEVYRVDRFIPGYRRTTSDHFPVLSHFLLGR